MSATEVTKQVTTGDHAPAFVLPDQAGQVRSLDELRAGGPIVLFFYPANFSPACTAEACSMRNRYDGLVDAGVRLAGISASSVASNRRFHSVLNLRFPVLSDRKRRVAREYGAKGLIGMKRLTVLIDADGVIRDRIEAVLDIGKHKRFVDDAIRSCSASEGT